MKEAKSCPFCGSASLGIGRGCPDGEGGYLTFIYCTDCRARGPAIPKGLWTCTDLCAEQTRWNDRK